MTNTTIVTIIILVVVFALVIFNYLHKKHIHYNPDDLKKSIDRIFEGKEGQALTRIEFLKRLRTEYNSSRKDALFLLGKASDNGLIEIDGQEIKKK